MKKLAENVIIQVLDGNTFRFTQSGDDFTYHEVVKHKKELITFKTCVNTEKFLACYTPDCSMILTEQGLVIKTNRSEVILPLMKEYGLFNVSREISEENQNLITSYEKNFKDVDLDLTDASGQFSYIMFNDSFVGRYLYNTMTYYGTITDEYQCVLPKQFKLLKPLGDCRVSVYESVLVIEAENTKIVLNAFKPVVALKLISRYFEPEPICSIFSGKLDLKKMKLFVGEIAKFTFKDKLLTISAPGYEETYDFEENRFLEDVEFSGYFYDKDFEAFQGDISIYKQYNFFYAIAKNKDLDKTVLFIGKETL